MAPQRIAFAEKPPNGVVRRLVGAADETIERRGVTAFHEGDFSRRGAFSRMRLDETEEIARHIAFSLRQEIVPRLPFLLEELKQAVLFVNHGRPHHPRLEERQIVHAQMRFVVRLERMLDGDMDAPFAA